MRIGADRRAMAHQRGNPAAARVTTPSGLVVGIPEGSRLVFGRGPDADLTIPAGRGLPRMEERDEPSGGWFLRAGTVLVGSRAMLDEGRPLAVIVSGGDDRWGVQADGVRARGDAEATLLPIYLDPMTKLFLVALMWCRPWLLDPAATTPLPRTPEIARDALQVTGAYHELERFDTDPAFRDRLSARVAEHIKVLRHKITDRGLVSADTRLSDEVVVRLLIEHGIVTAADLGKLNDPAWCSRQEDLWWSRDG